MIDPDCPFCLINAAKAPATFVWQWRDAFAIVPRDPVTPGHTLVIPRVHVADAGEDPRITAQVMARAAELMAELPSANIITSKERDATQSVFHLHVHVLPRRRGDNLALPWTNQKRGGDPHA